MWIEPHIEPKYSTLRAARFSAIVSIGDLLWQVLEGIVEFDLVAALGTYGQTAIQ
jgi:uncharacterized membrane protein YuzA (DUF378 family)